MDSAETDRQTDSDAIWIQLVRSFWLDGQTGGFSVGFTSSWLKGLVDGVFCRFSVFDCTFILGSIGLYTSGMKR